MQESGCVLQAEVIEVLISVCYARLCGLVALSDEPSSPEGGKYSTRLRERESHVHLLTHMAQTCAFARECARAQRGRDALLCYERHRLLGPIEQIADPFHFCFNYCPPSMDLLSGPYGTHPFVEMQKRQTVENAIKDRFASISSLESADCERVAIMKSKYNASDLHSSLPDRVRVFVGRARYFLQGVKDKTRPRSRSATTSPVAGSF